MSGLNVRARYLIVQISYSLQPFIRTQSEATSVPQSDIIPEVFGEVLPSQKQDQDRIGSLANLFEMFQKNQVVYSKTLSIGMSHKYEKFDVNGL